MPAAAARNRSHRRLASLSFVVAALAAAATPARAETADSLIRGADPGVQSALLGSGALAARNALATLLADGVIPEATLVKALSHPHFAVHAHDTLVALSQVQRLPGAVATFEKIGEMKDEGGIRGAAFEIQVGAALGNDVASLSATVDGDEVDAILKDGTRVEVKNDAPDESPTLSESLFHKAVKQLGLRGRYGDPVMLIANEPLSQGQAESFRRKLGPNARMLVLHKGQLSTMVDRSPETRADRLARQARSQLRPFGTARRSVTRVSRRAVRTVRKAPRRAVRAVRGRFAR